jgi:DNA-binding HxlR family transcriptional regulator
MAVVGPTELEAGGTNSVGRMLGLLGDEWTLLIIQQALQGVTRYGQFKNALPISNSVLTARLSMLEREGMLDRNVYQQNPPRAEYLTTARSRSLWPVMLSIWNWERTWVAEHADDLPTMHHATCGRPFSPILTCGSCGQSVLAKEIAATWGPSGTWERSVPEAVTRRRSEADPTHNGAGLFPETMTIFGNRWASALMGAAFRGVTRFSDFEASLKAPPTLVADRLRAFCAIGVLVATQNEKRPDWAEYRLTDKGRAFFPVVVATLQWAEAWFHAPEGPALVQTHRTCGQEFVAVFTCDQCGEALAAHDITIVPAAAESSPGAAPGSSRRPAPRGET